MKRVLAIILAAVLLLGVMPVVSFATNIVDSGTCGENLTWTLDDEGTLTISGTGDMYNYHNNYHQSPFNGNSFDTVIIEKGVTSIGSSAFYYCQNLKSLIISDSVTIIGECAFYTCKSLSSVTIPNGVLSIGDYAFAYCYSLTSIMVPDSVTTFGGSIFENCTTLHILCNKNSSAQSYAEQNNIAYGLLDGTEEDNTFSGSVGRLDWSIDRLNCVLTIDCIGAMPSFSTTSSGYTDAPWGALHNYVHETILLDGISSIGNYAFYRCSSMMKITIPDSVTSIGNNAFMYCNNIMNLDIPNSITTIGQNAFTRCEHLTDLIIPDSVTYMGLGAFSYCVSLKSIITPDLGSQETFDGCSNLKNVTIGEKVYSIRYRDFGDCRSLKSIDIPMNVTLVTKDAFFGCSALESVYFYNPNCTISAGATPANATVYGYSGSTAETYADQNGLRFMEIDGHEHHFTVTKTVEPTCTEDGYKNLSCPCGERTTETIPSNGHTEVIVPAKEATCTERGYAEWSYCEVCGETLTEKVETEAKDHTPVTTGAYAATCGKNGFTGVTYCTECKEVLDAGEPIPATNEHTPGEALEIIVAAATCTEAGASKTIVKCSACGETLSETTKTIAALGHTDGNGDEKCDRCNADMPKSADATKKSNVFDFLIQFFKTLADFFKRLFK